MKKARMYQDSLVLLVFMLAILSLTTPAWSASYFVYDQWGGTWHDANKTYVGDSLMCWAASASNVLDWGNWGTTSYNTESTIFQKIKYHWTNNRGYPSWAWAWWLNGSPPPYNTYAYVNVPGGGNYFPTVDFYNYYTMSTRDFLPKIDAAMHNGYGISMIIAKSTLSHAVTLWGFDYVLNGKVKNYTSIYITDSDDRVSGLVEYNLTYNNAWYLDGNYAGWRVTGFYGLAVNDSDLAMGDYSILTAGEAASGGPSAPLSPTWILFGPPFLLLLLLRTRLGKN